MRKLYALVFSLTLWFAAQAQYATNGTASMLGPNHYLLTQAANHSAGSVWNTTQVSLSGNFEITAQLYFGTIDDFADGIGFLLQSAGTTALGNSGAGLGYHGIAPSIVVEFDTYSNDFVSDIPQDHLGFMSNGSAYHADQLQPASPLPNLEDGLYHEVRFTWNAATKTLTVSLAAGGTYSYTGDIVNTHFGGNPMVYWGFTAGTGDGPNEHRVRIINVTTGGGQTPISITGNVTNASCTGGAIDITVSGGTAPYSYTWSNGGNTEDISNLAPGSYTVTVTDGAGTARQATFTVGDNGCVQPITITGNVTNAGCTGGAVDITVSGGVTPYSYSWSNGAATQDLGNVPAGTYTVTVTDGAGTTKQATFTVGNNGCVQPITITGNVTNAGCTGGAVDITVSGGVTPYSYSWSNGAATQDLGNVPAGSYTVTVTDGAGTTKQATFTVGNNGCVQPITITGNVTNAGCTGGAIDITVSGGVSPYTYAWSNGATTQDLSNVPAGSYTVTVRDAAGTTKQASFTVGNNGCTTTPITITGSVTNASCNSGGRIDISVSGGKSPYTYSWSNGATTQDLNNVPAGNYTVTVKDAAGTTKQASFTVQSGNDNTPPQLVCPATQTRCDNLINYHLIPELQASDNCGIASIKYVITGATSRSGNGDNASGTFNPGTSTITWTVKDSKGNTSSCTTQVIVGQVSVNIPDVYAVNPGGEENTIYIGYGPASLTLTANPSGGTGPYTYLWSTGATSKSITVNPNREGIYPYLVYVTDSKGCPAAMIKFVRVIDIRCGNNKVEICHVPAGKPSKADENCVSKNSVEAHLAHGDYLGSCRSNGWNDNDYWRSTTVPAEATEEAPAASPLNLRPNPSKGQFEVQLNSDRTETAQVMVLNSNGTVIESRTVQMTGKAQTLRFDLSRQASGIYLVKIVTGSGVRTEKVIIQK